MSKHGYMRYSFWRTIGRNGVFLMSSPVFTSIRYLYYCSGNYYRRKAYEIDMA